jgi:hypothetical protein
MDQLSGAPRVGYDRANMGFHAEDDAEVLGLLDTPVQFVHRSLPRIGSRHAVKLEHRNEPQHLIVG